MFKRAAAGIAVALLLACCASSSDRPRPAVCKLKAQQAIARDLKLSLSAVAFAKTQAGDLMPQCTFTARADGHTATVTVNVDHGPQAYFRLLRTVGEASQIFGVPPPGWQPPQGLLGLGPFASWFPTRHDLMATNDADLLTVGISWPGSTRNQDVSLARAAVVPYLTRPPRGQVNTTDYP